MISEPSCFTLYRECHELCNGVVLIKKRKKAAACTTIGYQCNYIVGINVESKMWVLCKTKNAALKYASSTISAQFVAPLFLHRLGGKVQSDQFNGTKPSHSYLAMT